MRGCVFEFGELTPGVQVLDNHGESLPGLLVQVTDSNASSQDGVILIQTTHQFWIGKLGSKMITNGVAGGHVGRSLSSKVVQLDGSNSLVNTTDNAFRDLRKREIGADEEKIRNNASAGFPLCPPSVAQRTSMGSTWFISNP